MGLRGRSLIHASIGIGISFFGYCLGAFIFGQLIGFLGCLVLAAVSLAYIFIKQKQGLHSKKRCNDILIYRYLFIRK